ncbi:STAS domain-containing protein [Actinoplanes sp. NPDC049668]|uniref:STAS domain-containing protein n=1 Tax=unclassified Actinoplanes TaxID=2626549 RepID=UPI0033A6C12D
MSRSLTHHCVIAVTTLPGSSRADVRIIGDVDTAAAPALTDAVRRLSEGSPRSVFIDLAGVTNEGPELTDFLIQAHDRLPRSSSLVVCRPGPMTRLMLAAADMMRTITVCHGMLG